MGDVFVQASISPMSVEVISCSSNEDIVKAWVSSRSQFLSIKDGKVYDNTSGEVTGIDDYARKLIQMDLGFNYFANITLRINASILLREYFYSFSSYRGKWAETARYSNPKKLVLSSEAMAIPAFYNRVDVINRYLDAVKDYEGGKNSQFDNTRELMPIFTQRMFQISLPIKLLIRILGHLKYLVSKAPALEPMWREVWTAFAKVKELDSWLPLIRKYSVKDLEMSLTTAMGEPTTEVGFVLYSQLIRHEGIQVKGFDNFLVNLGYNNFEPTGDCRQNLKITIDDPCQRMVDILRLRTSWFAVTDGDWSSTNTWGALLKKFLNGDLDHDKKYLKYFDKNTLEFLPKSVDSYSLDDDLRLHKGYNAYFPDAFSLESRKIVEQRIERYGTNPLMEDYLQIFDRGYVKDNPKNPKRVKWEELCK